MKAFVIKIKENCYWLGGFYGKNNYDDIAHAKVYVNKTQAEKQCKLVNESYGHNAKVVEITIAEGDLDNYIDKLQNERDFERRDKTYIVKQLNDPNDYVVREDYIKLEQENKQLKEQLAIKDKMIDKLVFDLCAIYDTENYTYGSDIIENTKFIKYGKDGHFDEETLEYIKEKYEKEIKGG